MSEVGASIRDVTSTGFSPTPLLPPVDLTPEEAAAVAVALAAQPAGPFAAAGREALGKVLAALEPDPLRRAELEAAGRRARDAAEPGSRARHPAGRARRQETPPQQPPRLVLLPGGLA